MKQNTKMNKNLSHKCHMTNKQDSQFQEGYSRIVKQHFWKVYLTFM